MNDFGTFTLGVFFGLIIAGIYLYFKVRSALSELDTLLNNSQTKRHRAVSFWQCVPIDGTAIKLKDPKLWLYKPVRSSRDLLFPKHILLQ